MHSSPSPFIRENARPGILAALLFAGSVLSAQLPFNGDSPQIMVDQFGFLPDQPKIAVFADPVEGFNNSYRWEPGDEFVVRRVEDGTIVYRGELKIFQEGAVDPASGDRVWWADFSEWDEPGLYVVVDVGSGEASHPFEIRTGVYAGVLKAAVRMFYYNRSGIAKPERYAGKWTHGENHAQTRKAQFYDTEPRGRERDVSGGWWDAGDFNKYSLFTANAIIDLYIAFDENPGAFPDNWNIPESGNGIPDLIDELHWELSWLLKMQDKNSGGVYNIAGTINGSGGSGGDPAEATLPWYYSSITTWATAGFAGATAHGSRVLRPYYPALADELLAAAERAWAYLEKHPEMEPAHGNDTSNGKIGAGDATGTGGNDLRLRIWAAAELFRSTGKDLYHAYFLANYLNPASRNEGHHPLLDGYFMGHAGRLFLNIFHVYAESEKARTGVVRLFHSALHETVKRIAAAYREDGYLNDFDSYWWGSNMQRAYKAHPLLLADLLDIPGKEKRRYRQIASHYLNYLHGRNPLNLVYLSNMGPEGADAGAERSLREIFHVWFADGSRYDGLGEGKIGPAPGYLAGGPNQYFEPDWISPPHGQPPGKSFLEFNSSWNDERHKTEDSWAITEPAIYYQSAYIRLLSAFVPESASEQGK